MRADPGSPVVKAIGIDMTSVAASSNVLVPEARAKISMRIRSGSGPEQELDALVRHLESHSPWRAKVQLHRRRCHGTIRCGREGTSSCRVIDAPPTPYPLSIPSWRCR